MTEPTTLQLHDHTMTTENALSTVDTSTAAGATDEQARQAAATPGTEQQPAKAEGEGEPPKKEKTPEEREIARLRRRVDNLTARYHRTQAELDRAGTQPQQLTREPIERDNRDQQADSEPVSLTRAELDKLIDQRARAIAPTITQQESEAERRRGIVTTLAKEWGQEKFDTLAAELDDAFSGLKDAKGQPKPAVDAIFESDDARALIEYLADPENADEAEALGRMAPTQAGRAVAKLEAKLATTKAAAGKPQASKAADPIEPVKGGGNVSTAPDPANTKAYIKWANEQERRSR